MTLVLDGDSQQKLRAQLAHDEGFRQYPYIDSTGNETIGYGRALKIEGISKDEALYLMTSDIQRCEHELWNSFPAYATLNDVRKSVLINMSYNLGIVGLMGFRALIDAITRSDWEAAEAAMLDSTWYHQVGTRAQRLGKMMLTGEWMNV